MPFWKKEKVERVSSGHSGTLALDQNDRPLVAFAYHGSVYLAQGAKREKWNTATVDSVLPLRGCPPGLALDRDETAHIAYCDMSKKIEGAEAGALCYAKVEKGKASLHILDKGKPYYCGVYPSMALSRSGGIAISYHYDAAGDYDLSKEIIKLGVWDGTEWHIKPLEKSAPGGYGSSVAFDSSGKIHLAFNRRTSTGAVDTGPSYYASETDGEFLLEQIDPHDTRRPSLTIDDNDRPHISYVFETDNREERLAYATHVNGEWKITELGPADSYNFGGTTSIALNRQGNPLIAFNDRHLLKLATFSDNSWRTETIFKPKEKYEWAREFYPVNPSLRIDKLGNILVCFTKNSILGNDEICLLYI